MMLPLLSKSGEPDEPPSVTPWPLLFAVQTIRQCEPVALPHWVETVVPVNVEIFLMSPAGWWILTPPVVAAVLAFQPFQ